jgi:hypothetical protein
MMTATSSFLHRATALALCLAGCLALGLSVGGPHALAVSALVKKPLVTAKVTAAPAKPTAAPSAPPTLALAVTPIDLVRNPAQYLNKTVKFEGEFTGFTGLGLDYSKALRPAKDFVGLLVRRPDVRNHIIPLSELKMFYPRTKSEAITTLESGDQVSITGTVFSTALGEPWVEVSQLTITHKKTPKP